MDIMTKFMNEKFNDIQLMSSRICKSIESEEVAMHVISKFLEHPRNIELIESGDAMRFMSGMIHRSFHSSTSPYHKIYRQNGRVFSLNIETSNKIKDTDPYDTDIDIAIEVVEDILKSMSNDKTKLWYQASLLKMWILEPNYSELSRQTKIPRTSISAAVNSAKEYIRNIIKNKNIKI